MDPYLPEYLRRMKSSSGLRKVLLFVVLPAIPLIIAGLIVYRLVHRRKR